MSPEYTYYGFFESDSCYELGYNYRIYFRVKGGNFESELRAKVDGLIQDLVWCGFASDYYPSREEVAKGLAKLRSPRFTIEEFVITHHFYGKRMEREQSHRPHALIRRLNEHKSSLRVLIEWEEQSREESPELWKHPQYGHLLSTLIEDAKNTLRGQLPSWNEDEDDE